MVKILQWNKQKLLNSELKKKLYNMLLNIYNEDMWALGIMYELDNDVQVEKMIKVIEDGETDIDELSILSEEI